VVYWWANRDGRGKVFQAGCRAEAEESGSIESRPVEPLTIVYGVGTYDVMMMMKL